MNFGYYVCQLFAIYISKVFFRQVILIGKQNIPQKGPVIIFGNHNNQFIDGVLMIAKIKRHLNFIVAAVSIRRKIIGRFLRWIGAIPVQRPHDLAKKANGIIIEINGNKIIGKYTDFSKLSQGQIVVIPALEKKQLKVKEIISDTQIIFQGSSQSFKGEANFLVIPKLQQKDLYSQVWKDLNEGKFIGIFPQGVSHDNLSLLPLKAGICIMALGAMQKGGKPIKMVPCGYNYYSPGKFRSRVAMQVGQAYTIPQQLVQLYRKNKKQAISKLLSQCQKMLTAVTTQFRSYKELKTLFIARQLYTLNSTRNLTFKQKLELNRRFSKGFTIVSQNPQYKQIYSRFIKFSQFVRTNGIRLSRENFFHSKLIDVATFIFYLLKFCLRSMIAAPGIFLFGPTVKYIGHLTQKQRIRSSLNSTVKQQAHDIVGSYKVLLSMALLPITTFIHCLVLMIILTIFFELESKISLKISLLSFSMLPFQLLIMVKSYDSFEQSWIKLKNLFMRLSNSNFYNQFNNQKRILTKKILELVQTVGRQVVQNFDQNRILTTQDMVQNDSEIFIFDKEEEH